MNIYLLTQSAVHGYDTFNAMVVVAEGMQQAKEMHPVSQDSWDDEYGWAAWALNPEQVTATLIGTGEGPSRIVLRSFHAG